MLDLDTLSLPDLFDALTGDGLARRALDIAREEDLGRAGDITTASTIDPGAASSAHLVAREPCTVAGLAAIPMLLDAFDADLEVEMRSADGLRAESRETLAVFTGPLADILALERTLLNLLSRMCAVASTASRYVEAVRGTRARILDTRKTTPALRAFDKYAVRCGGAHLHRIGLHDAVLIKDNHLAGLSPANLAARAAAAARAARARHALRFVEVEVDDLGSLDALLSLERGLIDIVLLDNMPPAMLRDAVARRDRAAGGLLLEASGGVTLETVRAIAETGVDRISVGALTHGPRAIDLALDIPSA